MIQQEATTTNHEFQYSLRFVEDEEESKGLRGQSPPGEHAQFEEEEKVAEENYEFLEELQENEDEEEK